jgi:hypothetical protein
MLQKDWPILKRLLSRPTDVLDHNYLRLAAEYIRFNSSAVRRLFEAEQNVSRHVLDLDTVHVQGVLEALDGTDRQSLFAFKLYCALNAHTHQTIADYFAKNRHSDWVRQRLLYPLIFYFINMPTDEHFAQMLIQMLPDRARHDAERAAVDFLLRVEAGRTSGLAFKCYLGLLCHPFDALSILETHFEQQVASGASVSDISISIIEGLISDTRSVRLANVLRFVRGQQLTVSPICRPRPWPLGSVCLNRVPHFLNHFWRPLPRKKRNR